MVTAALLAFALGAPVPAYPGLDGLQLSILHAAAAEAAALTPLGPDAPRRAVLEHLGRWRRMPVRPEEHDLVDAIVASETSR